MFKLEITTSNAAFEDNQGTEVARILREVVDAVSGSHMQWGSIASTMRDANGNAVGEWSLSGDK